MAAYSSRSRRASTATWMVGFGIGVMVYLRFSARLILRSCLSISLVGFLPEPEAARMLSYSPRLDMEPSARLIILVFILVAFVGFELRPFVLELCRCDRSQRSAFAEAGTGIAPCISEALPQMPHPAARVA